MIYRTSVRLDESVRVDRMARQTDGREKTVKITAVCIALGLTFAYGGFYGWAAAFFILAIVNDQSRRRA